ncbi:SDR family oxidoreductase [Streptomyces sp. TRM 70351]|uniref:KR domain-containing protein n=1 Tax=Streptomyces sp. TRM 70351 TaxID=3116552 RepID=UPI002E7ACF36|nr:SDR family oxidoreductase [Streptomyces sp. TRM 70351]MEE1928889.1 SDR family oxidoreductase [Streptomyces sp. TRM 70351]
MERHVAVLLARPGPASQQPVPALPPGSLVLTDIPDIAARVARAHGDHGTTVVCTRPLATGGAPGVTVMEAVQETVMTEPPLRDRPLRHIRVLTDLRGAPWPAPPGAHLTALQELLFLATRRLALEDVPGSSVAVLVCDPLRAGLPHPHSALLTGFLKCAAWEVPDSQVYGVVTDAPDLGAALRQLTRESAARRGLPVAYHRGGERYEESLAPAPLPDRGGTELTDDSVVVAVGGARGITATALAGLVRQAAPTLWLLGSTPVHRLAAQARALGTTGRAAYLRGILRAAPEASVPEAVAHWERLRATQEALRTLAGLRARCGSGRVRYLTCDVTDPAAVHAAAADIGRVSGRVHLLLNAAGVGQARALRGKRLDDYRRVRGVKVDGYHHLKAAFDDPPPDLWCSFSSIAGVAGLPGESDYGPANDLLDAAARYEVAVRDRSECAIGWTMWGESGLGPRSGFTDHTRRTGRLSLLGDAEGQRLLAAELAAPRGPQTAVPVYLGPPEKRSLGARFPALDTTSTAHPLLPGPPTPPDDTEVSASWPVDLRGHAYLHGHRRNAVAVLPGALAVELAAEAAGHLTGGRPVAAVTDVRFRAPVVLEPRDTAYVLHAVRRRDEAGTDVVHVEIRGHAPPGTPPRPRPSLHFHADVRATVRTDGSPSPPSAPDPPDTPAFARVSPGLTGLFGGVHDIRRTAHGTRAVWSVDLRDEDGEHFGRMRTPWLLLDAAFQTAAFLSPGRLATPSHVAAITFPVGCRTDRQLTCDPAARITLTASAAGSWARATADCRSGDTELLYLAGLRLAYARTDARREDRHPPGHHGTTAGTRTARTPTDQRRE